MQWFLALNESCPAFKQYAQMARVAIHTALAHTSLQPHCIYDGEDNEFTAWLQRRKVRIIRWQSFLCEDLAALGERLQNLTSSALRAECFCALNCRAAAAFRFRRPRILYRLRRHLPPRSG